MNKLNRLYKKAIKEIADCEKHRLFMENLNYITVWYEERKRRYNEKKEKTTNEQRSKELDNIIREFEEIVERMRGYGN